MKNRWIMLSALALAIAGCSSGGGTDTAATNSGAGEAPELTKSDSLEVAAFKGGYGSDFYEAAAKEYAEKAGIKVDVVADPRIWEQIRPRFVQGTPPDLAFPGWGFDHWALVAEDGVLPLDHALNEKPWGAESGTWRDTFDPAILRLGQSNGKQYVMPFYVMSFGWWYDPNVFAKNGWTPPKTWDELLTLCEKIKAAGMAPITYQGQYPFYMIDGMLTPWVVSIAGQGQLDKMQNLEPGAWKDPSVVKAAAMIKELKDKGYFQSGATAMSHTEAQTQFVNGKAAMIPCGTWLHSEMKNSMPATAKMQYFLPPAVSGGAGDPSAVMVKIEPWLVPAQAKNQYHAIELFKYMTSLEKAKQFVTEKGTLMSVKGSDQVDLPEHLKAPSEALKASKAVYSSQWGEWYPEFYKAVQTGITKILNGELTPEAFAEMCEKEAEKVRNDPDIIKHKVGG